MNFFESIKIGIKNARNIKKEFIEIWDKLKLVWKYEGPVFILFYLVVGGGCFYGLMKEPYYSSPGMGAWTIWMWTVMRANYLRDVVNKLKSKE